MNRDEDPDQRDDGIAGLDELRHEGEVEERGLGIEDVVEEALREARAPRASRPVVDPAVARPSRRPERQDAEHDEVVVVEQQPGQRGRGLLDLVDVPLGQLVDLVGPAFAKDILYSARTVTDREALAMGRDLPMPPPAGMPGPFGLADPDRNRQILADAGYNDIAIEDISEFVCFGTDAQARGDWYCQKTKGVSRTACSNAIFRSIQVNSSFLDLAYSSS